jgi:hypothetical protein
VPCYHEEDDVDLDAFRQMVAKNPKGFLGRYGLGNKLIQEGGNLEEAILPTLHHTWVSDAP